MNDIGETLREAREARGLTLDDVEKAIHIRLKHLAALESGDFDALPSPVQARGFLRNYAGHLGLDADELVERLDEAMRRRAGSVLPGRSARARGAREPRRSPIATTGRARWFSVDLVVAAVITTALIAVFVWGGARLASAVFGDGEATPTVSSFFLPTNDASTALPRLGGANLTPTPPPLESYSDVQIQIVAQQRSWMRVLADGQETYLGMVTPGERLEFSGSQVVEIATGNGAGLHVIFNGRDQGTLGKYGEVVTRLWTLQGMITPTPAPVVVETQPATTTP